MLSTFLYGQIMHVFDVVFVFLSNLIITDLNLHNFSLDCQSNMIQLLEIILGGGTDKIVDSLQPASVNSLVDLLPTVSSNSGSIELDDDIKCGLQGIFFFFFF